MIQVAHLVVTTYHSGNRAEQKRTRSLDPALLLKSSPGPKNPPSQVQLHGTSARVELEWRPEGAWWHARGAAGGLKLPREARRSSRAQREELCIDIASQPSLWWERRSPAEREGSARARQLRFEQGGAQLG